MCTSYANRDYRVAVFLDGSNINGSFRQLYGEGANYEKVLDKVLMGNKLHRAIAYAVRLGDMERWLKFMGHIGFEVKVKEPIRREDGTTKADWDLGICLDVVNQVLLGAVDAIVLLSGDGDFADLIKWCQSRGVIVIVGGVASSTAMAVKENADKFIPLGPELALKRPTPSNNEVFQEDVGPTSIPEEKSDAHCLPTDDDHRGRQVVSGVPRMEYSGSMGAKEKSDGQASSGIS